MRQTKKPDIKNIQLPIPKDISSLSNCCSANEGLVSENKSALQIDAEYLTTAQAAQMTGFTEKALGSMRDRREGPQYFKVGRLVRYRSVDIHMWIQQGGAMV